MNLQNNINRIKKMMGLNEEYDVTNSDIKDLFDSNYELTSIGSPQDYSNYLNTIFPNSKIKDIFYHSSPNEIENFRESMFGTYFSYSPLKYTYGDNIIRVILNITNPLIAPKYQDNEEAKDMYDTEYRKYNNPISVSPNGERLFKYDASIESSTVTKEGKQIKVRNPEQIHILGSKKDLIEFKNYVDKSKV